MRKKNAIFLTDKKGKERFMRYLHIVKIERKNPSSFRNNTTNYVTSILDFLEVRKEENVLRIHWNMVATDLPIKGSDRFFHNRKFGCCRK